MRKLLSTICMSVVLALFIAGALPAGAFAMDGQEPIRLRTMGSLLFGGTVQVKENGDTFHGDHGYAQFYIPQNARQYPLIMWHGMGQSGRSWESTPDGREGYQAILTRHDWPVYIIDQPRRGRAGYTSVASDDPSAVPTTAREGGVWNAFRNGQWESGEQATLYPNVQFPVDPASIDQFFRQQTPNTGEEPRNNEHRAFMAHTVAALLEQTGPSVLITHSNSGSYGWFTAMAAPDRVKAVVAYEPGQLAFPEGEQLAEVPFRNQLAGQMQVPIIVSKEEFCKLTRMPIVLIYGDNIATELSDLFNEEVWRISLARAKEFVAMVNKYGGDATLVSLPELGIKGNTHVPFADLNSLEVAAHLQTWLSEKGLDGRSLPHVGPKRKVVEMSIPLASNASSSDQKSAVNFTGENGTFPRGGTNDGYAQYFTGTSYLNMLTTDGVTVANVTFEPGCRNDWHVHRGAGQILLITDGRGWYQESGKPAQELHPGDVVNIPAGAKHWHGAAKDSWFAHLAVSVPLEGAKTEWLEKVSDAEFNQLK